MNAPVVSIILVNYNTAQLTCDCIQSIYNQVHSVAYEIIMVDNASKDSSVEDVKRLFPEVVIIESAQNLGFGRANNLGVKQAKGEYLFLLNTDTLLLNDPFPYFLNVTASKEKVGVIGAFLKDKNGEYVESGGENYSIKQRLKYALIGTLRLSYPEKCDFSKDLAEVDFVIGADMFFPKDVFVKHNGFDDRIFMYFEEADLCKRIQKDGYRLYLTKGPEIIHLIKGSSNGKGSMFSKIHTNASIMYVIRKESNWLTFRAFQLLFFIIKSPVLLDFRYTFKENWEYLTSIYNYKKYLNY